MVLLQQNEILAGRQILDGIDIYNRVHDKFNIATTADSKQTDYADGFGHYWENEVDTAHVHDDWFIEIPTSSSQIVLFKPLSGILN